MTTRRPVPLVALALAAACGGSSTTDSGPADTTPPQLAVSAPNEGDRFPAGSNVLVRVITDEPATCAFGLQDGTFDQLASRMVADQTQRSHAGSLTASGSGNRTIYIRCRDAAGNANPVSRQVNIVVERGGPNDT